MQRAKSLLTWKFSKMELPISFANRMKEYLEEEYGAFIKSYDLPEVKGLRMKNTEIAPGNILGAVFDTVPWCENGYSYYNEEVRPGKNALHESGAYYIQEPSAMSPVEYLSVKPGDRVLDLCAAPGGKSTQIGVKLAGEGLLISNEIMPDRAKILSENIERMGVANALVISEDPRNISDRFAGYFDKILVDAPCSGEGMFRRSEIAVNEWSPDNVNLCADRQEWILDEAAKMLAPGGVLVYSTCTFSKEEDEYQISAFLDKHEDFELKEMPLYGGMKKGFDGIGVRLWPHHVDGEGHYVCKLAKKGGITNIESKRDDLAVPGIIKNPSPYGLEPDISKKDRTELKEMFEFFKQNISEESVVYRELFANRRITRFKDQIYLLPEGCPSLKGLKVLRPGLHLGTILKNRFEPGHALSHVLSESDVKNACILQMNSVEAAKYINGETFNYEINNGWCVVFVEKNPLGWGKVTNGIVKNHYPKGLRKTIN